MAEEQTKEEKKQEGKLEQIYSNYSDKTKVQLLGDDTKNYFLYNPDNERLVEEACNNSGLDIEIKAFSEVIVIDCFHNKCKEYVAQIKKVTGKDTTNPLFKDKRLIITVNGDRFYSLKEKMRKYYLLKELSRVLYNYEKDSYKILKYEYNNNYNILEKYGLRPTEDTLDL